MLDQDPKQGAIDLFPPTTVRHGSFHEIATTSLLVSGEAQGDFFELLASVLVLQACW
jgi:hypothetical protein